MPVVEGAVAGFTAFCGEAEDPDGDNSIHRICHACAAAKSSTKGAVVTTPAGKRNRGRARNVVQEKQIKSTPRARLKLAQKLEILQLLDQEVTHYTIAGRFKCGLRTVSRVQCRTKRMSSKLCGRMRWTR